MRFVIDHLSKHFEEKEVLREITFTFEEGKIYGLLGRNGAGKTTLFNCLNRDLRADNGRLRKNSLHFIPKRRCALPSTGYMSIRFPPHSFCYRQSAL